LSAIADNPPEVAASGPRPPPYGDGGDLPPACALNMTYGLIRQRDQGLGVTNGRTCRYDSEGFSPASSLFPGRHQHGRWLHTGSQAGSGSGGGCRSPGLRERSVRLLKHGRACRAKGPILWGVIDFEADPRSGRCQGRSRQGGSRRQDRGSDICGNTGPRGSRSRQGAPGREGSRSLRHPTGRHRDLKSRKPHRHARCA
jgi:hypothetical protein